MRILSLGCALPHPQVDNYDWASALSFYEYDAMVVDPAEAVSKLVEGVSRAGTAYATYDDQPIVDGPTSASGVGLADLLRRRRDETERLLARGGLVVCFAYPDVPHTGVSGFTGCHRYYWLPAPPGRDYGAAYVKPAGGRQVKATDYEHAFADLLESLGEGVLYRAALAEGAAGFGRGAKVIGRSAAGAAVALDITLGGGHIVFLPALAPRLSSNENMRITNALVAAVRNALLLDAEAEPPGWLEAYALPGIAEATAKIEAAETRLDELETELAAARNEYRGIDRYRRLLWQGGKYGFDLPVRDALVLLGFLSLAGPDEPAVFHFGGERVFVETEGSSGAVGMNPHYRLRQRLEKQIAGGGERARGIIVINGHCAQAPEQRPQQFEDSLRVAAESMRYCVVEASQLFAAVRDHLEGRGDAQAFCQRLINTEGVFAPLPAAAAESSSPAGTPAEAPAGE